MLQTILCVYFDLLYTPSEVYATNDPVCFFDAADTPIEVYATDDPVCIL